jgi:hypothetical protein
VGADVEGSDRLAMTIDDRYRNRAQAPLEFLVDDRKSLGAVVADPFEQRPKISDGRRRVGLDPNRFVFGPRWLRSARPFYFRLRSRRLARTATIFPRRSGGRQTIHSSHRSPAGRRSRWPHAYQEATAKQWTQPIGFAHALFEVAVDALKRASDVGDRKALVKTIQATSLDTLVGHIAWDGKNLPPFAQKNIAKTPLVGGQWRLRGGTKYDIVIVDNKTAPQIPVGGDMQPIA